MKIHEALYSSRKQLTNSLFCNLNRNYSNNKQLKYLLTTSKTRSRFHNNPNLTNTASNYLKFSKPHFKYFSSINTNNPNTNDINTKSNSTLILKKYKEKIDNSLYIFEEIFHKEIKTKAQLISYFDFKKICTNISLSGSTPLDSINNSIFAPCWDMVARGGKRWRPILGLMIADLFKINLSNPNQIESQKLYFKLLYLVESLHNASLILDDVEDKSESRRNAPCVHLKYGEAIAINAGISFLFFPFYKIIQQIEDPLMVAALSKSFFQEVSAIHIGQGWDIEMNVSKRTPSIENYNDTVLMKTGVFPRLIVKLLKILIKNDMGESSDVLVLVQKRNYVDKVFFCLIDIVDNMSIAFQIKDDLLNITDSELAKGKGFFGEDIFEGKLTLMILHSLNKQGDDKALDAHEIDNFDNNTKRKRLREILDMKTKDQIIIKEAVEILRKNESIKFAEDRMNYHMNKAITLCDELIRDIERSEYKELFDTEAARYIKHMIFYLIDRSI